MNTKTEIKWFFLLDYIKEAEYLRQMHNQGWKISRIGFPCFYHFEQCTPADMVYQLDYNQEGLAHKDEYLQMFADCGWTHLFDFVGYSYFRKPAAETNGSEDIFCDDASRLDMVRRILVGRLLPLFVIFMSVLLPQSMLLIPRLDHSPVAIGAFTFYVLMLVVYMAIFTYFFATYTRMKHQLGSDQRPVDMRTPTGHRISSLTIIGIVILLIGLVFAFSLRTDATTGIHAFLTAAAPYLCLGLGLAMILGDMGRRE